ncbi:MAG: hypothetical protein ACLQGV_00775 [Bryobacteraceae bacterium]
MRSMFAGSLALAVRSAIPIVAMLACSCGTHGFVAVLIDAATKKPVPSVRIILAPKKDLQEEGKYECTINTALTGVSNERGEVRIPNLGPGEYVVFQSLPGKVTIMDGTVVTWGGSASGYNLSLGSVVAKKGALVVNHAGHLALANGYMEAYPPFGVLGISTTAEGALLTVHVPGPWFAPSKIEINPAPPEPAPPQGAPKSGQ